MQADEQASKHLQDSSNEPDSPSRSASHDEDGSLHGSSDIEESDAESEEVDPDEEDVQDAELDPDKEDVQDAELDPDEEDVQDAELQLRHTMAASVRFALGLNVQDFDAKRVCLDSYCGGNTFGLSSTVHASSTLSVDIVRGFQLTAAYTKFVAYSGECI